MASPAKRVAAKTSGGTLKRGAIPAVAVAATPPPEEEKDDDDDPAEIPSAAGGDEKDHKERKIATATDEEFERHKNSCLALEAIVDKVKIDTLKYLNFVKDYCDISHTVASDFKTFYERAPERLTTVAIRYENVHLGIKNEKRALLEKFFKEKVVGHIDKLKAHLAKIRVEMDLRDARKKVFEHYTVKIIKLRGERDKLQKKGKPIPPKDTQRLERNESKLSKSKLEYIDSNNLSTKLLRDTWRNRYAFLDPIFAEIVKTESLFMQALSLSLSEVLPDLKRAMALPVRVDPLPKAELGGEDTGAIDIAPTPTPVATGPPPPTIVLGPTKRKTAELKPTKPKLSGGVAAALAPPSPSASARERDRDSGMSIAASFTAGPPAFPGPQAADDENDTPEGHPAPGVGGGAAGAGAGVATPAPPSAGFGFGEEKKTGAVDWSEPGAFDDPFPDFHSTASSSHTMTSAPAAHSTPLAAPLSAFDQPFHGFTAPPPTARQSSTSLLFPPMETGGGGGGASTSSAFDPFGTSNPDFGAFGSDPFGPPPTAAAPPTAAPQPTPQPPLPPLPTAAPTPAPATFPPPSASNPFDLFPPVSAPVGRTPSPTPSPIPSRVGAAPPPPSTAKVRNPFDDDDFLGGPAPLAPSSSLTAPPSAAKPPAASLSVSLSPAPTAPSISAPSPVPGPGASSSSRFAPLAPLPSLEGAPSSPPPASSSSSSSSSSSVSAPSSAFSTAAFDPFGLPPPAAPTAPAPVAVAPPPAAASHSSFSMGPSPFATPSPLPPAPVHAPAPVVVPPSAPAKQQATLSSFGGDDWGF